MRYLFTVTLCALTLIVKAQVPGCMDPLALNYDATAGVDDGSCIVCYTMVSETFSYTGAVQTFTVPNGVDSLTVLMSGAQGGYSQYCNNSGYGGSIQANLEVISNSLLYFLLTFTYIMILILPQQYLGYLHVKIYNTFVIDTWLQVEIYVIP